MGLFNNRVAVVTGAGTGLGRATAIKLASAGARVVLVGRRKEKLEEVAQVIEQANGNAVILPADVTKEQEVQHLRDLVLSQTGRVDVLINNAGGTVAFRTIHDLTYTVWDSIIRLNLYSPFLVTNAFLPIMRKQQYGRIVSITSVLASEPCANLGAYAAAKAGLEALMKTTAIEESANGILVNLFDPGNLLTEQNPYGKDDPATVADQIITLAALEENGLCGQVVKAKDNTVSESHLQH